MKLKIYFTVILITALLLIFTGCNRYDMPSPDPAVDKTITPELPVTTPTPEVTPVPSFSLLNSYVFFAEWGTEGAGDEEFDHPLEMAIDAEGNFYFIYYKNNRIQKFDSNGNFITKWGEEGSGDGQFDDPSDIAVDTEGNVFVVDYCNHRIQKFDSNGNFITKWGGEMPINNAILLSTRSVTADSSGNIFVADNSSHIFKFTSEGKFIKKYYVSPYFPQLGRFYFCSSIAIDATGCIYVAQARMEGNEFNPSYKYCIRKFDKDGKSIKKWGTCGKPIEEEEFSSCGGLTIDLRGYIYVADPVNSSIQVFDMSGNYIDKWEPEDGEGKKLRPTDIAMDGERNFYILETKNNRILKFIPGEESEKNQN